MTWEVSVLTITHERNRTTAVRLCISTLLLFLLLGCSSLSGYTAPPVTGPVSAPQQVRLISETQAAVLGVVEGITEYLPVSSTGHLLLAQHFLGITGNGEEQEASIDAYLVIIQFGAILAVLLLYFGRVRQVFAGIAGRNRDGLRLLGNLVVAFLPAMIIGLLLEKKIKTILFGTWPVVIALAAGGLVILAVVWKRRRSDPSSGLTLEQLTVGGALVIGLLQCVAMWPGTSRSLMTILGGLAVGMSMGAAVEFSFLLGMITLSAATAHDVLKYHQGLVQNLGTVSPVIGLIFAGLAAFVAVRWMVGYLNRHGLALFGYYRIALAVVVLILLATRMIA